MDGDGRVTADDATLVATDSSGTNEGTPFYTCAADVNCDQTLDILDSLLIAQYANGTITDFPCS